MDWFMIFCFHDGLRFGYMSCLNFYLTVSPGADEPTSGLDSTTAMHLVTTLRQLAAGGRAVVTTIHQPSSRLYLQLDKLLLLSEGHICYYGESFSCLEIQRWCSAEVFP